jgi:hypothetical protein
MSLREQLQGIYETHGRLTPAIVVDEARPEDHPLHTSFEWDDSIAGEKFRLNQARDLIQSVRITRARADNTNATARAFTSVADGAGFAYRPTEEVLADPLLGKMALADMEREWRTFKARWEHMQEFRELILGELAAAV